MKPRYDTNWSHDDMQHNLICLYWSIAEMKYPSFGVVPCVLNSFSQLLRLKIILLCTVQFLKIKKKALVLVSNEISDMTQRAHDVKWRHINVDATSSSTSICRHFGTLYSRGIGILVVKSVPNNILLVFFLFFFSVKPPAWTPQRVRCLYSSSPKHHYLIESKTPKHCHFCTPLPRPRPSPLPPKKMLGAFAAKAAHIFFSENIGMLYTVCAKITYQILNFVWSWRVTTIHWTTSQRHETIYRHTCLCGHLC